MTEIRKTLSNALVEPLNWLILGIAAIVLVPIIRVFPELQTFIHPWRPELAASIVLIGLSVWAFRSEAFRQFVAQISSTERYLVLLPLAAFIVWSGLSAAWANSWTSVLHHTTVWIAYLAFYIIFRFFTSTEEGTAKLIIAAMCVIWIICLPPLLEYFAFLVDVRPPNIGIRYSKYAELANTFIPVIAAFSLLAGSRLRVFGFATVLLVWLFHLATQSRTAIGVFPVSIAALFLSAFFVRKPRQHLRPMLGLLVILVIATLLSATVFTNPDGKVPVAARFEASWTRRSTNVRPFLVGVALVMLRHNVVTGVGADNFGLEFDDYRRVYSAENSDSDYLNLAEDQIAERTHNEYAQILSELGIVGLGIFCLFLLGILYTTLRVWKHRQSPSIVAIAAFIGIAGFFASSLVSGYSFRIFQNGLIFFLVLAIAIRGSAIGELKSADNKTGVRFLNASTAIVVAACIALAGYSVIRVAAVQTMIAANAEPTIDAKEPYWAKALRLDPENAYIYSYIGLEHLKDENTAAAVPYLRETIERGRGTVMDYSHLASAYRIAGDLQAARDVLNHALDLYPASVFIRTRLGVVLSDLGDAAEAEKLFAKAVELDPKQAFAWRIFIESGGRSLSHSAIDTNVLPVMDLLPNKAIYAMQMERELRFPDEKYTWSFK